MADIRKTEDLSTRVQLSFLEQNTMPGTSNTQPSHKDATTTKKQDLSSQANALCLEKLHDHADRLFGKFAKDFDRFFDKARLKDGSVNADELTLFSQHFHCDHDEWPSCIELEGFETIARRIYGETGCMGLCYVLDVPTDLVNAFCNPNCQVDMQWALASLIDEYITLEIELGDGHWEPDYSRDNVANWQVDGVFLKLGWDRFNEAPKEEVIKTVLDAAV